MSQMVDGEGTGDEHGSITNEEHVNAQGGLSSSTKSLTKAAPDTTVPIISIDATLVSLPVSKQSQPPKILPNLNVSHGDTLVKEEGCEQELQSDIHSQLNVEANVRPPGALQNINPEMVSGEQKEAANTPVMLGIPNAAASAAPTPLGALKSIKLEMVIRRLEYLQNQQQPRGKAFSSDFTQNVEDFRAKLEVSSLDEILFKEMNPVFLQQLLDHILEIPDAEEVIMSPLTNSTPTSDPVLDALAAAPSCHRRANAELPAVILDDAGEDARF